MEAMIMSGYLGLIMPNSSRPSSLTAAWRLSSLSAKDEMDGFPWTIQALKVRCPCGTRFENADAYLQHKGFCAHHRETTSTGSKLPGSSRTARVTPAKASITASSPELTAFGSSQSSRSPRAVRGQRHGSSASKQQTNTSSALLYPGPIQGRTSDAGSMSPSVERLILPLEIAKKIHCACGGTFKTQAALEVHLRYSKAHHAESLHPAEDYIPLTPGAAQPTTPHASLPQSLPASASVPGTIPHPRLSVAHLLRCTCGQSFETQRILDLHKRDSLYHQRQANDASAQQTHREDLLTSALASLTLHSEPTLAQPPAVNLVCICGCIFSTQSAFDQHNADAARYAWLGDREARGKSFGGPRLR